MSDVLKKGLSEQKPLGQKEPRGETNKESQRPTIKKEKVKGPAGTFTIK